MSITFKVLQIARNINSLYLPPDYHAFHKVWLKLDEHRKFCKVHRMTSTELSNDLTRKVFPRTANPKLSSVSVYGQSFSRYCTFYDFPIDSHVKISKCNKIVKLGRLPRKVIACIPPTVAGALTKFDWHCRKPIGLGGVAF